MIAPKLHPILEARLLVHAAGFESTRLSGTGRDALLWVYETPSPRPYRRGRDTTVGRYITVAGILDAEDVRAYILSTMTCTSEVIGRPSLCQDRAPRIPGRRFVAQA